jgi:hypothetical protein
MDDSEFHVNIISVELYQKLKTFKLAFVLKNSLFNQPFIETVSTLFQKEKVRFVIANSN